MSQATTSVLGESFAPALRGLSDKDSAGWGLIMPAPCVALTWNLIDIAVCRFWALTPVYTVGSSCILVTLYAVMGSLTGALYS